MDIGENRLDEFLQQHALRLAALEKQIGYTFKEKGLLRQALTHKSFTNENPSLGLQNNEPMEFLGDSVMGFIISVHLYQRFAARGEGDLSRFRSYLVSGQHLVGLAQGLGLGPFILLGRGEAKTGGFEKKNILVDTLEALVAAIYLDGGIRSARPFVLRIFRASCRELEEPEVTFRDFKSQLQEYLANTGRPYPRYTITGEQGPDHEKTFFIRVEVGGAVFGTGQGPSKKEAQQEAARNALNTLTAIDDSTPVETPETDF